MPPSPPFHWNEMGGTPPAACGESVTHCPAQRLVALALMETPSFPGAAVASAPWKTPPAPASGSPEPTTRTFAEPADPHPRAPSVTSAARGAALLMPGLCTHGSRPSEKVAGPREGGPEGGSPQAAG